MDERPEHPWRQMDEPPDQPMPILLFFGNYPDFGLPDYREVRVQVGFWDGDEWCESCTGHDVFEEWRDERSLPTGWQPLPMTPAPRSDGGTEG